MRRTSGVGIHVRGTTACRPADAGAHAGNAGNTQRTVDAGAERAERVDAVADTMAFHHAIADRPTLADAFSHTMALAGAGFVGFDHADTFGVDDGAPACMGDTFGVSLRLPISVGDTLCAGNAI